MHTMSMMPFSMIFMWIIMIAFVYLIIKAIRQDNKSPSSSAIEVAKCRFANGEITQEELKAIKKEL
ncbi:SHOCT domain-containing protein [Photobacterium profundum]|uniref:SHOCT domain-containing protein n=1 Tax=Photobacterium profundum TaxID=74109 RepID=UPI0002F81DC5|nr:hypothetical protein [Photobacterium profundum]